MTAAQRSTALRIALTLVTLSACAGGVQSATTTPEATACLGTEIAVVRNETGAPVDVFVFSGRAEVPIGTARLGRNEFTIPPLPTARRAFNVRTLEGTAIRLARPSQSPASRVNIAVECRG
jgi:hypothetical protein